VTDAGKALAAQGKAARDEDRIDAALELYGQAAAHARQQGDTLTLAHRLRHIGDIHQDAGRDAEAAPYYDEALALYRSRPDAPVLDLANMLRPLAMLKEKAGARAEAAALWAEAAALYAEAGVEIGARESARRLAALA
jgi:tetratricopeptide (TPR) repeat protein